MGAFGLTGVAVGESVSFPIKIPCRIKWLSWHVHTKRAAFVLHSRTTSSFDMSMYISMAQARTKQTIL